jgi:hypothetical protein
MPRITTNNSVLDWSLPVYVSLLVFVGLVILTGGFIWLRSRRTKKRQMIAATKDALSYMEQWIRALYHSTESNHNADRYGVWRVAYIKAVEAKFNPHIWQECARAQSLPPYELIFEPAQ